MGYPNLWNLGFIFDASGKHKLIILVLILLTKTCRRVNSNTVASNDTTPGQTETNMLVKLQNTNGALVSSTVSRNV